MAITGSGTQADPYIVHTKAEIQTACESTESVTTYVKLANDIDFKDDSVWNTPLFIGNRNNPSGIVVFDLDSHALKNIRNQSALFQFGGDYNHQSHIKNGKILNIFSEISNTQQTTYAPFLGNGTNQYNVRDLSISIKFFSSTNDDIRTSLVQSSHLIGCAAYLECSKCITPVIEAAYINACDLELHINDLNNKPISSWSGWTMGDTRVTGKISGNAMNNLFHGNYQGCQSGCVIDVDFSGITSGGRHLFSTQGGTTLGAVNGDTLPPNASPSGGRLDGMAVMNSQTIRNGNALRNAGFTVVNIGD